MPDFGRHLYTQCGDTLDLTPINAYRGDFAAIDEREDAVVLIDGDCTGTLVAAAAGPVVLTAGHCTSVGRRAVLAFNVETDPDGDTSVIEGTTIEQADQPDYALILPDLLPAITPTPLAATATDRLAIIQHPRGQPKQVAEGTLLAECGDLVTYRIDTLGGSSGAGVLTESGWVAAVHTDGDCDSANGGTNWGATASAIVAASSYLTDADLLSTASSARSDRSR